LSDGASEILGEVGDLDSPLNGDPAGLGELDILGSLCGGEVDAMLDRSKKAVAIRDDRVEGRLDTFRVREKRYIRAHVRKPLG